jgi:hypothetical protein
VTPTTLLLDRIFPGVGRVKKASGTTVVKTRNKMNRMLTTLYEDGRLDILRAIRDGQLTPMEVYSAFQRKALHELPLADSAKHLSESMSQWIQSLRVPLEVSAKHKSSLETSRRYFVRTKPNARVTDIPAILETLRESLGREYPTSFNLARAAALAYVRSTLKKSHPLWLQCSAVEKRKVKRAVKPQPLSKEQMLGFFPNRESDPVDAIAWGMYLTGMGAEEYWGKWNVLKDRVHIAGTKRKGRIRDVPLLEAPSVPTMHRRTFEDKVRGRSTAFTVRDFRRSYANNLEAAGVPRTRRRLYLGHGAGDVTDLYELHEVAAFLIEDGARIRTFLSLRHTIGHTIALVQSEAK